MKVTVIYPGLVATEMGSEFGGDLGDLLDRKVKPEQFLQPKDVADAVLAACSPYVGCVTEISLHPQTDLYRMRILTEPNRIQALVNAPVPNFADKRVAIITGAGKGIGRGIALRLASEGYNLALLARTQSDLESLTKECYALSKEAGFKSTFAPFAVDVTNKDLLANSVQSVVEYFGTLSVVISNAGTNRRKSAALASIKVWEDVVQTNLISSMHLTSLSLPHLLRHAKNSSSKSSYLVFINSGYANPRAQTLPGT